MSLSRCHRVRFLPEGAWVQVLPSETLKDAARKIGIEMMSACGGQGTCKKCGVRVLSGKCRMGMDLLSPALKARGHILACQAYPEDDLTVEVPVESRLTGAGALLRHEEIAVPGYESGPDRYPLSPLARKVHVTVDPPTLSENMCDLDRLLKSLRTHSDSPATPTISLPVLRKLPQLLRANDGKVAITIVHLGDHDEIVQVDPSPQPHPCVGLAIDIGTTTVTVYLVNLKTGDTLQRLSTYNEQFVYGEDVITRIVHASRSEENLDDLRQAALRTVNGLIDQSLTAEGYAPEDLSCAVVAGNTTMTHLFLGVNPKHIRLAPYIPAAVDFPPVKAGETGLHINPQGYIFPLPSVGSYVGGDIVAGALSSGIADSSEMRMLVGVGTNGGVVVGNEEFLVASACSIGPAFEGGGITCGMRSVPGAIHRVTIEDKGNRIHLETVGDEKPIGLCGSGLVEALASLVRSGALDRSGNFSRDAARLRITDEDNDPEFVLLASEETQLCRDLALATSDVKNLMRAKAALFSGMQHLVTSIGLTMADIKRIYVAGAFGSHMDIRSAVEIGMLADVEASRHIVVGNSSVKGARLCLLSQEALREATSIAAKMTYLELSVDPTYMDEFMAANFLPHTNLSLFPSVSAQ